MLQRLLSHMVTEVVDLRRHMMNLKNLLKQLIQINQYTLERYMVF